MEANRMQTPPSFTLILTRGTHLISLESAQDVREAIERKDSTVEIALDPFGGADSERRTMIAVRHVVALTRNEPRADDLRVTRLEQRARITR